MTYLLIAAMAALAGQTPTPRPASSASPAATPSTSPVPAASPAPPARPNVASVLSAATASDWRPLDPENTVYLELATGRVVMELAPAFAPNHVANVKALVREGYFDGLSINRVQDNYVVQWGDPNEGEASRKIKTAKEKLPGEFDQVITSAIPFTPSPDGDVYAAEAGWSNSFPAARDPKAGRTWIPYCYGVLGTARATATDSGGGSDLFVIIGHSPRHLDRNYTAFGRVVKGIELLSVLPRGSGNLGRYTKPEQRVPIQRVRMAADVPESERTALQILRTDTPTFRSLVNARRTRTEEGFAFPVGRIEVCNVPIPTK
jgi:peptidylprolyl isomerase